MKPMTKGSLFNSLSSDRSKVKVKVTKRSKTYISHTTLSFHPIYMKPKPNVHFSTLFPLIGQRSRSKSQKGQKHILVITQFSSDSYETNAKMFIFNSLTSDRSKVKVKVKVRKRSKTYFGHNALSFCPIHMKLMPKCSLFNSLSSDRSKVKVNVTKRSKIYFGQSTLSFRGIHMKPVPKCSLFNSLSFDRSNIKVKVKKRSKTYSILVITRSFHPIHMKPVPKCSLLNSLSSDRSKVKVKVTKRSKTYFGHNTLIFIRFI